MTTPNIKNLIVYNSTNDISYIEYNKQGIPYMFDTTYIYHNNQNYNEGPYSQQLRSISNNLIIESATSNIVMASASNKKVIVKNNMAINNSLDVSNIITTNRLTTNDMSLAGVLYLNLANEINVIGNLNIQGGITFQETTTKEQGFEGRKSFFETSTFNNGDISNSRIYSSTIYSSDIRSSYILNTPIGYDKDNNIYRNKAIFNDVSLNSLTFDSSINGQNYIKFTNPSNPSNPIIIQGSQDHSKLEINTPLMIGSNQVSTNISNISIFHGDISCHTLYYKQLNPDIRLNNYFDVSIGNVSISGNIIPSTNIKFDIGSTEFKFNNIHSSKFIGELSGNCSIARNLERRDLDMSFNNLDISGVIRINGENLSQTLTGSFLTISKAEISFNHVNSRIQELSSNVYSSVIIDLCLNTNYATKSYVDLSFIGLLTQKLSDISSNVYSKTVIDNCLNINFIRTDPIAKSQFKIYDKFTFELSGIYTQTIPTGYNTTVISEWRTNWISLNNPVIRFLANGDILNLNNSYGSWSDIRLKENIVDVSPKLQDLLKVRVVNYNLIGLSNTHKNIGVIAQELETIFPNLVTELEPSIEDIKEGKTEKYKAVKYSSFSVILIKALQEEQEVINKLDTRIVTLNKEYNSYKDIETNTQLLKDNITSLKQENILLKSKLNEILAELGKNIIP